MQEDFHYYATYCAAYLAGHNHEESLQIGYWAQFVDCCSKTYIDKVQGPKSAATTQLQTELADASTDIVGLQDITRIWASFHFLPGDLYAERPKRTPLYMSKYRLICDTNSDLLVDTIDAARKGGIEACGLAMHILADTWAHRYFAGTPSFVINDANDFAEIIDTDEGPREYALKFRHNPVAADDIEKKIYTNSVRQDNEGSIMNLGHGRAGHLPDYSFIRYRFMPAWNEYEYIVKDNPSEYYKAFCQMVYAMKCLKNEEIFEKDRYAEDTVEPYKDEIMAVIRKRQLIASDDWKAFGKKLSGKDIDDFDIDRYAGAFVDAVGNAKDDTALGKFFVAALRQKSMVTNKIYKSGNLTAGYSVEYGKGGFEGMGDFRKLIRAKVMDKVKERENGKDPKDI